jgi:hypothetical protein
LFARSKALPQGKIKLNKSVAILSHGQNLRAVFCDPVA